MSYYIVGGNDAQLWSAGDAAYVPATDAGYIAWLSDQEAPSPHYVADEQTLARLMKRLGLASPIVSADDYAEAIEAHADAVARSRQYRDADRLASYVNSGNAVWAAEANAFGAWRDAVWVYAYTQIAAVQAGQRPQPSIAGLISELPVISWPS